MRKRSSTIWSIPNEVLIDTLLKSNSMSELLRNLKLKAYTGARRSLIKRVKEQNLDTSHFGTLPREYKNPNKKNIEEFLVKGKYITTSSLRKRLIKEGLLKNRCSICLLGPTWQGCELVLQLDHINGDSSDNRLNNLRILCPNCHTQTDTHSAAKIKIYCRECNKSRKVWSSEAHVCNSCFTKKNKVIKSREKVFIAKEDLEKLIWEMPTTKIGKLYNLSDKAIEKRCKKYGIEKPCRGYWQKLRASI